MRLQANKLPQTKNLEQITAKMLLHEEFFEELIKEAISLGGVGSGEHGVGHVKHHIIIQSKSPAELELLRGIKRSFDPLNILNPGKMFFPLENQ